jgi:hypothetical protein
MKIAVARTANTIDKTHQTVCRPLCTITTGGTAGASEGFGDSIRGSESGSD